MLTMRNPGCAVLHGLSLILIAGWCAAAESKAATTASPPVYWVTNSPTTATVTGTASPASPPASSAKRSAADLAKLAAPIALYPDPLIASILPAAVYPLEIVKASRFVADTNNMAKIDSQPWDTNVKAVAKIPGMAQKMNDDLDWTTQLGQAFLEQPMDLMNAIQDLRAKAKAAGTLKTTPQQKVTTTNAIVERSYEGQVIYVTNTVIQVQPASTEVIYVPSYNPSVVYVDDDDDEAAAAFISFGVGIAVGAAIWGDCDWHYGGCYWGHYPPPPPFPPPYRPPPGARPPPPGGRPPGALPPGSRPPGTPPPGARPPTSTAMPAQRWQPDQSRLSSSGAATPATRDARGWGSSAGTAATRPSTSAGNVAARPSTGAGTARPSTGTPSVNRPSAAPSVNQSGFGAQRSAAQPSFNSPSAGSRDSAFQGVGGGSSTRSSSTRGAASRGGGFSGGRGGGGRGR